MIKNYKIQYFQSLKLYFISYFIHLFFLVVFCIVFYWTTRKRNVNKILEKQNIILNGNMVILIFNNGNIREKKRASLEKRFHNFAK